MSHPVLALGLTVVTLAGSVWYVPALADLRAGADRTMARRTSAAACVSGWSTAALVAVLLLVDDWRVPGAVAGAGAVATAALALQATVQHRRTARETARAWAQLVADRPVADRSRATFAAVLAVTLVTAVTTVTLLLTATGAGDFLAVR
ncbi:hypothetical protein [Streptomyces broussonetiae]|uniref:DUF1772 domain-containing protein n=1 Tax=Streptomyces broussonetiae TaxID=2686304 RepID=A0ABV5EKS6_9ACTN